MSGFSSELLTYPFEKGVLPFPDDTASTLVWGARYFSSSNQLGKFDCVQSFKPYAENWSFHQVDNTALPPENRQYSTVFCALPKQKEASLYRLAFSLRVLNEDGLLLAVAANDAGGKRLEKWFVELGLQPESLSKSKCRIVWARKKNIDENQIAKFITMGEQQSIQVGDVEFITQPGIFGWNKIDKGSKLLTQSLPCNLKGDGADFGCGYGYLSDFILDGKGKIKILHVLDADYNALQCSKENLKKYEEFVSIKYKWQDLTSNITGLKSLDWIVMNPPFHEEKEMSTDVGVKFIEIASQSLRRGGRLYMVANAHLPYEKILNQFFSSTDKVVEEQGFKVFLSVK